jgi:two-component system NarL family sensor kinase
MSTAPISKASQMPTAVPPEQDLSTDAARSGKRGQPYPLEIGEPVSVRSVVVRFALAGFIALAIVCAVTAWVSLSVGTERAIDDARMVTRISAQGIVAPALHDDLIRMEASALQQADDTIRAHVLDGSLVRVKIWAEDGTIVYADESRLIGERFELSEDQRVAFATGAGRASVSALDAAENRFEVESDLLEVYQPIETVEGSPLLFEAYFRYSDSTDVGRRLWGQFAPVAIAALLVLELVQLPFAWRMAKTLQESHEERERLLRQAIGASELERRRIGKDLHDGVIQDLSGVSFSLAAQGQSTTVNPAAVAEAAESIRASITSLRSLLVEISPRELTENGLEYAIRDLMSGLSVRGVETALEVGLAGSYVDDDAAALGYRVVQEALRNAVSHARATAVKVVLSASDAELKVVVDDNGRGFASDDAGDRLTEVRDGLELLGGRLTEVGGSLEVLSAIETGTRVIAVIRLTTPATAP